MADAQPKALPNSTLNLNRQDIVAEELASTTTTKPSGNPDPTPPDLILMFDIESLALGPNAVITQIAMLGYDLNEDILLTPQHVEYYPVDPQQTLLPPRVISALTIWWWMTQGDDARSRFELSTSTDFHDLPVLIRNLIKTFNKLTSNGSANYEVVAKGPQFDIVAIETLIKQLGFEVPWRHDSVVDLRTMLKRAGLNEGNTPKPIGFIPHVAYWDALWQIDSYLLASKALAR